MVTILERNDVLIWTIKSPERPDTCYYEDEYQVFAEPYRRCEASVQEVTNNGKQDSIQVANRQANAGN